MKMDENITKTGIFIFLLLFAFLGFAAVNISSTVAVTYVVFLSLSFTYWLFDKKHSLPLSDPKSSWLTASAIGLFVYVIFILTAPLLLKLFQPVIDTLFVMKLIGATTPVFANSKIFMIMTYCVIAFIETLCIFVVIPEMIFDYFKIQPKKLKSIISFDREGIIVKIVWVAVSIFFYYLHFTAKGIENSAALFLVFLMALVSIGMVLYFGEGKQAAMFHFFANFIASMAIFGLLSFLGITPGAIALIIPIFILNSKLNLKI